MKTQTKIHHAYDVPQVPGIDFSQETSLTKQSFTDECDINKIVARITRDGYDPSQYGVPQYADVSNAPSFHEAMEIVTKGQQAFAQLPSIIRARFGNDPAQYLDFVANPENLPEMLKLGMATESPAGGSDGSSIKPAETPAGGSDAPSKGEKIPSA